MQSPAARWAAGLSFLSAEVIHAALEYGLEPRARDVLVEPGAAALRVAHLAQDPAVRRGDALDGEDGAVGIISDSPSVGFALQVHVLGGDLAVGGQLASAAAPAADEAALAVGDGDGVDVAHLAAGISHGDCGRRRRGCAPAWTGGGRWRCRSGSGSCASVSTISPKGTRPSLMSAWKPLQMPSIRPSRLLSSSLTASAMLRVAEEGGDELGAAVRLVAAGEAAGQDDHLAARDRPRHALDTTLCHVRGAVRLRMTTISGLRAGTLAARARCRTRSWCPGTRG